MLSALSYVLAVVLGAHLVMLVPTALVMCCIAGCLACTWCKRVLVLVSPMELQDMYVLMHDKVDSLVKLTVMLYKHTFWSLIRLTIGIGLLRVLISL